MGLCMTQIYLYYYANNCSVTNVFLLKLYHLVV